MAKIIGSAALAPGGDSGTDLTNKGDLHGYSSSNTRIPIGDNDQVLTADSAQALGLKWATASSGGLELLDYEDFGADAASYVFEPSSALTADDYSQFIIAISGSTDAVNAIPTIIFSESASNVYATGATIAANGTRTAMYVSGVAPLNIGNTITFPAADKDFSCLISMMINPVHGYLAGYMTTLNENNVLSEEKWFEVSADDIDKVEIEMTSTGKFKADTRFSMFGLKTS